MERLHYDEAREWFWVRTAIWFVPAALASAFAHFSYSADLFEAVRTRVWLGIGAGMGTALIGVFAGYISMQFAWMQQGLKISYLVNGPFCAAVAGVTTFLLGGFAIAILRENPPNEMEHPAAYQAHLATVDSVYKLILFAVGAAAFWGFLFGSWFAMRRDKYFVEAILD